VTDTSEHAGPGRRISSHDWRQLAAVVFAALAPVTLALAALALVVAAFAVPPLAGVGDASGTD
jgi:hypothetical protein